MEVELTDHLAMSRTRSRPRAGHPQRIDAEDVVTEQASSIDTPRDRTVVEPRIVRSVSGALGFDDKILASTRAVSTRDISAHLGDLRRQRWPRSDLKGHRRGAQGHPRVAGPPIG